MGVIATPKLTLAPPIANPPGAVLIQPSCLGPCCPPHATEPILQPMGSMSYLCLRNPPKFLSRPPCLGHLSPVPLSSRPPGRGWCHPCKGLLGFFPLPSKKNRYTFSGLGGTIGMPERVAHFFFFFFIFTPTPPPPILFSSLELN